MLTAILTTLAVAVTVLEVDDTFHPDLLSRTKSNVASKRSKDLYRDYPFPNL